MDFLFQPLRVLSMVTNLTAYKTKLSGMSTSLNRIRSSLDMEIAASGNIEAQLLRLEKKIQQQARQLETLQSLLKSTVNDLTAAEEKKAREAKEIRYVLQDAGHLAASIGTGAWTPTPGILAAGAMRAGLSQIFGLPLSNIMAAGGVNLKKLEETTWQPQKNALTANSLLLGQVLGSSFIASALLGNGGSQAGTLTCAPPTTGGISESSFKDKLSGLLGQIGNGYRNTLGKIKGGFDFVFGKIGDGLGWLGDQGDQIMYNFLGPDNYQKVHDFYDSKPVQYLRNIASSGLSFVGNTYSMMWNAAQLDFPAVGADIWKAANDFESVLYQSGALFINVSASTLEFFGAKGNYEALREMEEEYAGVNSIKDAFQVEGDKREGYDIFDFGADAANVADKTVQVYGIYKATTKTYENISNLQNAASEGDWAGFKGELSKMTGFKSGTVTMADIQYPYNSGTYSWKFTVDRYKRISNTYSNLQLMQDYAEGYMDGDLHEVMLEKSTPYKAGKSVTKLFEIGE